jgi:hypothetical protein
MTQPPDKGSIKWVLDNLFDRHESHVLHTTFKHNENGFMNYGHITHTSLLLYITMVQYELNIIFLEDGGTDDMETLITSTDNGDAQKFMLY